jgi:phytoene/squalene synthetase
MTPSLPANLPGELDHDAGVGLQQGHRRSQQLSRALSSATDRDKHIQLKLLLAPSASCGRRDDAIATRVMAAVESLPRSSRKAIAVAQAVFTGLSRRLRGSPADHLEQRRVRVSEPVNFWLTGKTYVRVRVR